MNKFFKPILVASAVMLLVGATPALAVLDGTWAGTGSGTCDYSSTILRPWESWEGEVNTVLGKFYGKWWDGWGNCGSFFNTSMTWISSDMVVFEGRWTVELDSGDEESLGNFKMVFYDHNQVCEGDWDSFYPTVPPTTMQGNPSP